MKERTAPRKATATEPVGIVISRGRGIETPPVFSAYMYAPVPEEAASTAAELAELAGV